MSLIFSALNLKLVFLSMNKTLKIKNSLHAMIDKIENEELLEIVYQLLDSRSSKNEGELLNKLSVQEKQELYEAYEDSQDNANLLDFDEIKKKQKAHFLKISCLL